MFRAFRLWSAYVDITTFKKKKKKKKKAAVLQLKINDYISATRISFFTLHGCSLECVR